MNYLQRPLGLVFLIVMILIGVESSLKKPLCIDSSIVYKIDSVEAAKTETVYSCDLLKKVSFSNFFHNNLALLQPRLKTLEIKLARLGLRPRLMIIFDESIPKDRVKNTPNGIKINKEMLSSSILERELFRMSLASHLNLEDSDFIGTMSDFFIQDDLEYTSLVSQAWNESYRELSFFQQREVLKSIESSLREKAVGLHLSTIDKLKLMLNLNDKSSLSLNAFAEKFSENLKRFGYLESNDLVAHKIDFLIEAQQLDAIVEKLQQLATDKEDIKIAVQNKSGIYLLPSLSKVDPKYEKLLQINYRIAFSEERASESTLKRYMDKSEKLVLIKKTDHLETVNFNLLGPDGVTDFLKTNKELNFIQFHLPSYRLKAADLHQVRDYYKSVESSDSSKTAFASLGWQNPKWENSLNMYKASAIYDVIQFFRVN